MFENYYIAIDVTTNKVIIVDDGKILGTGNIDYIDNNENYCTVCFNPGFIENNFPDIIPILLENNINLNLSEPQYLNLRFDIKSGRFIIDYTYSSINKNNFSTKIIEKLKNSFVLDYDKLINGKVPSYFDNIEGYYSIESGNIIPKINNFYFEHNCKHCFPLFSMCNENNLDLYLCTKDRTDFKIVSRFTNNNNLFDHESDSFSIKRSIYLYNKRKNISKISLNSAIKFCISNGYIDNEGNSTVLLNKLINEHKDFLSNINKNSNPDNKIFQLYKNISMKDYLLF